MNFDISEIDESKQYWVDQEFISEKTRDALMSADVIIAPMLNFREGVEVSFHQGTLLFFNYLLENLETKSLKAVVCSPDDEYYEIALHSKEYRFSKIIINSAVAPIIIGLLTSYIYDELKVKPEDKLNTTIVIEFNDCKTYKLDFDGKASDFPSTIDKIKELTESCNNTNSIKEDLHGKKYLLEEEIKEDNIKDEGSDVRFT